MRLSSHFDVGAECVLYEGDCLTLLKEMPDDFVQLVVTSPPYNLGKPYESRLEIEDYLAQQRQVIEESVRVLKPQGSICWQVGNYVDEGEIIHVTEREMVLFKRCLRKIAKRARGFFKVALNEKNTKFFIFIEKSTVIQYIEWLRVNYTFEGVPF